MHNRTGSLFKNKFLVGMVHLAPLLDFKDTIGIEKTVECAIYDALIYKDAGYDAILIENNYDLPHDIFVSPGTVAYMGRCISEIKNKIDLPIGVCVLWNDYRAAFALAKTYHLQFVRVAVFVDYVETDFGKIPACFEELNKYRKDIGAEDILLFTDIQVKHAEILNKRPIEDSAKEAITRGSDGLIITGQWTGDAPTTINLANVRACVDDFPIIIGSGADKNNVSQLLKYADGIIVGTSVKEGSEKSKLQERNLKPFSYRIDKTKAKTLQKKFAECL